MRIALTLVALLVAGTAFAQDARMVIVHESSENTGSWSYQADSGGIGVGRLRDVLTLSTMARTDRRVVGGAYLALGLGARVPFRGYSIFSGWDQNVTSRGDLEVSSLTLSVDRHLWGRLLVRAGVRHENTRDKWYRKVDGGPVVDGAAWVPFVGGGFSY